MMDQKMILLLLLFSIEQGLCQNNTVARPSIFQPGIISTGDNETHPAFSPTGDTLYFLKCLADASFCSICVSYNKNGGWTSPQIVSFSGRYLDADPFVTKDGKTMYFVSNRPVPGADTAREDWDIWKTELTGNGWGKPIHLDSTFNTTSSEYYPTLSDNGNLYFGSSGKKGKGGADIYVSRFIDNRYTAAENLGDSINTADNEYEPYIAPDESFLIYMVSGANIASADFYISFNKQGVWSKGQKFPAPLNSSATDWGGKLSRDQKYFFFGSNRNAISGSLPGKQDIMKYERTLHSAGHGSYDIYKIEWSTVIKLLH
jgi:WD40-like Beta Propeller Repeat